MRKSNLCILACCVGVSWATFVTAQTAANMSDDQDQALQALRQAEAVSVTEQILADAGGAKGGRQTPPEQKSSESNKKKRQKKPPRKEEKAAEEAAPPSHNPRPLVPVAAASADDKARPWRPCGMLRRQ